MPDPRGHLAGSGDHHGCHSWREVPLESRGETWALLSFMREAGSPMPESGLRMRDCPEALTGTLEEARELERRQRTIDARTGPKSSPDGAPASPTQGTPAIPALRRLLGWQAAVHLGKSGTLSQKEQRQRLAK
jgi:hypothetical protein